MTDRTTPQEASRAAFEAAMAPSLLPAGQDHPFYDRRSNGHYNNEWMQARWIGWQAATQARDAECAALRDALSELATHFRGTNADDGQCDKALQIAASFKEQQ